MKQDSRIKIAKHVKIIRVQRIAAHRKGTSALGTRYLKGHDIIHISSTRSTREIQVLTCQDLNLLMEWSADDKYRNLKH